MKSVQLEQEISMETPRPWRRGQPGNPRIYGPDGQGKDSGLLAVVYKDPKDADLIVRAVNCHDELVAALERAREYVATAGYATSATDTRAECVAECDAALAKAKE